MKALKIGLLVLTLSSTYAASQTSDLQTIVTVQRSITASSNFHTNQTGEEVAFEFEKTHTLLENSRDSKTPATLILPLGKNETGEFTVHATTNHIGQILWKGGRFVPVAHPYLAFEGKTEKGDQVQGFISEQSFSATIHSVKDERILVQSKSLQIASDLAESIDSPRIPWVEEVDSPPKNLFSPLDPTNFRSPVDANQHVRLRHMGLLLTLTPNTVDDVIANYQAQHPGQTIDPNVVITDWVTYFAREINSKLKSQLGLTVDPISALGPNGEVLEPEKDGVRFIAQIRGGYPGQPKDSIFGDPSVPKTTHGWADANHKFQSWVVQNGGANPAWWDAGLAIGDAMADPAITDPIGGVATLRGLCSTLAKGYGYTSTKINSTLGGPGHVKFALHELGHLMGAGHTFSSSNNACGSPDQLMLSSSVEPGSGTTLMSYAGECAPDNVESSPSDYYHGKSIEQINTFLTGLETTSTCISHASTQNRLPVLTVSSSPDLNIIPKGVRFELTANFTDPDLDTQISQNPNSISDTIKKDGPGRAHWEQIDPLANTITLGPRYRSFYPNPANYPSMTLMSPNEYRSGYVRSFPYEWPIVDTRWDPLITSWDTVNYPIGIMNFRITGWDYNADNGAGFPGFVSADVPLIIANSSKPSFTFPSTNQFVESGKAYSVTWLPNFAATQPNFAEITLSYKHPGWGQPGLEDWLELRKILNNVPSNLNAFSNVQFPKVQGKPSYTTTLRLKFKTYGDVTWYVESPPFHIDDKIFTGGFESN